MRTRELGSTGITVSELSLGTWGLSGDSYGPIPAGEADRVISRAAAMGINLFETASSYGRGQMEQALGTALEGSTVTVVTKWGTNRDERPPRKQFDADYLKGAAEASRKRLGDSVKMIGLLHNPSEETMKRGEATATLEQLQEDGVISSWGVSAGNREVANLALDAKAPVLSFAYNILQVQPLRSLEERLLESKTGVLAHSVLFYGLLTGRWSPGKTFRAMDHRSDRWPEGSLRTRITQLAGIRPLVSGDVLSLRSAALRFVLENQVVASAVLGPRNGSHLDTLVRDCQGELPYLSAAKKSALENRLKDLDVER